MKIAQTISAIVQILPTQRFWAAKIDSYEVWCMWLASRSHHRPL